MTDDKTIDELLDEWDRDWLECLRSRSVTMSALVGDRQCREVSTVVCLCPGVGERVEHLVGELRRRKDLVVRQVGDACEHVGIAPPQREARPCWSHSASSLTVNGG